MPVLSEPRGRPSRRERSREQLLDATEALLADGGHYADLPVDRIAARAGVARSTFYVHFADRRALLLALADRAAAPLAERLATLAEERPAPDETRLADAMRRVLSLARAHAPLFRAVVEAAGYDDELRAYWHGLNERVAAVVADRLAEQRRGGRARSLAPAAAARVLVAMVSESCLRQLSAESPVTDGELAETLAAVWWRAAYEPATG